MLLSAYTYSAWQQYEEYEPETAAHSGQVVVPDTAMVPEVNMQVTEDKLSGWNIQLQTENFAFTPQKFGEPHQLGEGHAHLYLDGEKLARIYGPWYHIGELMPGTHELVVTLNANNHDTYYYRGNAIADTTTITVE